MKKSADALYWLAAAAMLASAAVSCAPGPRSVATAPMLMTRTFPFQTVGYSLENRPIELFVGGGGAETIFIFSTIHGNEQAGVPLCYRLMDRLQQDGGILAHRLLLIMPIANPDGVARNSRGNANGIDLNRNFPAPNREDSAEFGHSALSEPESRILYDLINRYRPARIVTIHQPLLCIDYDGPAESLAHYMAEYCPLPVRKLGARPGSFGAWAGEKLQIPTITLELGREDDGLSDDQLWQKYGLALMAAVTYPDPPIKGKRVFDVARFFRNPAETPDRHVRLIF